jgi:hypothetical protein
VSRHQSLEFIVYCRNSFRDFGKKYVTVKCLDLFPNCSNQFRFFSQSFFCYRHFHQIANYFFISSDQKASIGLPKNLYACLFTTSSLVVLCTISIFCLIAVSIDRYWVTIKCNWRYFIVEYKFCYFQAILHPFSYSRNVRTKTAIGQFKLLSHLENLKVVKGKNFGSGFINVHNAPFVSADTSDN